MFNLSYNFFFSNAIAQDPFLNVKFKKKLNFVVLAFVFTNVLEQCFFFIGINPNF